MWWTMMMQARALLHLNFCCLKLVARSIRKGSRPLAEVKVIMGDLLRKPMMEDIALQVIPILLAVVRRILF